MGGDAQPTQAYQILFSSAVALNLKRNDTLGVCRQSMVSCFAFLCSMFLRIVQ